MINVKNVYKSFGNLEVLKGITHEFKKGKTTVILGASGSGKSTLLRSINRLNTIDSGDVFINNQNIDELNDSQLSSMVLMVFQRFHLFRNMTVLKNISYSLRTVKKMSKEKSIEMSLDILSKVNMLDKKDVYPSSLSGGQMQRVAIARVLVMNPEAILFDEPTSALDPESVNDILEQIRTLTLGGFTNIIVTHEVGFAKEVADEIIYMDEGKIIEVNDAKSFFTNPSNPRTKTFLENVL